MIKKISVIGLILASLTPLAYGGFIDLGVGARPLGMGHAFVGVANDVNALYYNPAGLINVMNMEFCFMYAPLMIGLTDGSGISDIYGAFAMKLTEESAVGAGWLGRGLTGPGYSGTESLYNENTIYGSYAMWLSDKLILGLSVKVPMHSYGEDGYTKNGIDDNGASTGKTDPTFSRGYSKIGISADVGALYQLSDALTLGVMMQNIISSNIALYPAKSRDVAPMYLKAGVGYKIPKLAIMENITVASDFVYHAGGLNDIKLHSGFEAWLFKQSVAARAGFGIGTNSYMDLSVGGSYVLKTNPETQIDYAWTLPLSGLKSAGDHRFSCTLRM